MTRPSPDCRCSNSELPDPGLAVPVRRELAPAAELELKLARLDESRNGKEPESVDCVHELELAIWGRRVGLKRDRSDAAAARRVRPDIDGAATRLDVVAHSWSGDDLHVANPGCHPDPLRGDSYAGHQNAPKLSGPVCAPTAAPTR
jgi:hypothetical protein